VELHRLLALREYFDIFVDDPVDYEPPCPVSKPIFLFKVFIKPLKRHLIELPLSVFTWY
jgi:hypothetical protein